MLPENLVYVLESLSLVGPSKAVGYLPIRTVTHVLGLKVEGVIADAEARGLEAITFGPRHCCIKSGALYVFDQEALERILRGSSATLQEVGAPLDPQKFVRFIARNWFASDSPIMPIIRTAFADDVTPA